MPGEFYIEGKQEKVDLNEIRNILSEMQAGIASMVDFWSEPVEEIQINAAGITVTLPDVAVLGLPSGASVMRAVAMLKFRMVENTNAAPNRLNGGSVAGTSQVIQARQGASGDWFDAVGFVDGQFGLEGQTREGGDVCFGSMDVSEVIAGNGILGLRWLLARANADFLNFNDVQAGIRIWYLPGGMTE
ncbi:MAG: hypothetical protein M0P55_14770 [Clostridiales bacterium]|nr:hypothetical protein [Clostridiales bacterium]